MTEWQGATAAQGARSTSTLHFRCLSIRSFASRLPHLPPQIPRLHTRELDWPDHSGVRPAFLPQRSQVRARGSQACFHLSPHAPQCCGQLGLRSWSLSGELHTSGAAASPRPLPGDPGGGPVQRSHFRRPLSPTPPTPSRSSWALKAGGWAGPQAEAAAGAGGRAQELSEGRAPPPEPPSLPPTFPRPALPAHPSPRGPPPAARRPPPAAAAAAARSGCRTIKQASQRPPPRTPARRPSPRGPPLAARAGFTRPVAGRGAGRAGAGRGAEAAGTPAAAPFSGPGAATSGGMGGR